MDSFIYERVTYLNEIGKYVRLSYNYFGILSTKNDRLDKLFILLVMNEYNDFVTAVVMNKFQNTRSLFLSSELALRGCAPSGQFLRPKQ